MRQAQLRAEHRNASDAVGLLADRLRQHFCGSGSIMHRPEMLQIWLPAFAALKARSGSVVIDDYKKWLTDVATSDFADELILTALAIHLRIWIVAIPANAHWIISEYPHQDFRHNHHITSSRRVILGNNDIHYVMVAPREPPQPAL